jgi:hypothetical protein
LSLLEQTINDNTLSESSFELEHQWKSIQKFNLEFEIFKNPSFNNKSLLGNQCYVINFLFCFGANKQLNNERNKLI